MAQGLVDEFVSQVIANSDYEEVGGARRAGPRTIILGSFGSRWLHQLLRDSTREPPAISAM